METKTPNDFSQFQKPEKDRKKGLVTFIILGLLALNIFLLWQFFSKKNTLEDTQMSLEETANERNSLQTELTEIKTEFDRVNQDNMQLQSQLSDKDEEIKAKVAEIEKLIRSGDAFQLKKAKNEMAKLKMLNQIYIAKIDSLNTVNQELNRQNVSLNQNLSQEKTKSQSLTQENVVLANKVAVGAMFKTENVSVTGVRYKSSGKEIETNRASNVEKIRSCFTILENLVTDPGRKNVYVRILGPDNAIMSTSTETFTYKGQPTIYTTRELVEYNNERTDVCVYWSKGSEFPKGDYTVELYSEGNQIGKSVLSLK
jgi:hypothetical protein